MCHATTAKALGRKLTKADHSRTKDPTYKDKDATIKLDDLVNRYLGCVKKETSRRRDDIHEQRSRTGERSAERTRRHALRSQFLDPNNNTLEYFPLAETHPITR
jgi:hypothetical protein